MKIYVFGNPILRKDSLALRVAERLKKKFPAIEFKKFDTAEDLEGEALYVMDVAEGIEEVKLIENLDLVETRKIFSLHDYDLSYELKLLKKIGKIKKVFLICIPAGMKESEAIKQVESQIHLILKK